MRDDALMHAVAIASAVLAHERGDDDLAVHRRPDIAFPARRWWPFCDKNFHWLPPSSAAASPLLWPISSDIIEDVVQPDLSDGAFASAGIGDHYPPQLLAAAAEHGRRFGEQGVIADPAEEISVVVDAHDVPGTVKRQQRAPAGDGFHDGAVDAAVDDAGGLP